MRKRFEVQYELGAEAVGKIQIPITSRDEVPAVLRGLQYIYTTPQVRDEVFSILEEKIMKGKKKTGREGMSLWEILVLGTVRLARDIDYDQLEHIANYDRLVRLMIGAEGFGGQREYAIQTIKDNVSLLDAETLKKINKVVVEAGHDLISKKKVQNTLSVKVDSYVLETNVHFPTDLNLLWDGCRKCIELIAKIGEAEGFVSGWRKQWAWYKQIKIAFIMVQKNMRGGGKGREEKIIELTEAYIREVRALSKKIAATKETIEQCAKRQAETGRFESLEYFAAMVEKHIDLVERRIIKGEKIPHEEKLFSLFEPYTEWVNKGKSGGRIELGLNIVIASDQYGFILEHLVLSEGKRDAAITVPITEEILKWDDVRSVSFDKGFWSKENYAALCDTVEELILPKKGRLSEEEQQRESTKQYKALRRKHCAVESDIHALEHHGLNRCPDRGKVHFESYVALGILSLNVHRLGNLLLMKERIEREEERKKAKENKRVA